MLYLLLVGLALALALSVAVRRPSMTAEPVPYFVNPTTRVSGSLPVQEDAGFSEV